MSIQTVIDRLQRKTPAVLKDSAKLAEYVSVDDAQEALRTLSQSKPQRFIGSGLLGAAAAPAVKFTGNAVQAVLDPAHRGRHLADALRSAVPASHELAGQAAAGFMAGGVLRGVAGGIDAHKAKKTLRRFMSGEEKAAAAVAPGRPTGVSSSAAKSKTVGAFSGMNTTNALKPPGPPNPGVIRPTASIKSSIAGKAL